MSGPLLASLSAKFTGWDWGIVAGYLILTTWLGARMAGKQATIRDFFLGGRKLPWYAVCGSIIATEISAVTFVGLPYVVFKVGGNFTYLQLGLFGSLLARIIVGYVLVPAYYRHEIYSPYDYMGRQLGGNARGVATALFTLSGLLSQSARVYLTALVLTVVLADPLAWLSAHFGASPLAWSIILITIVAVIWTLIGGITTVIWTDVMLFAMFLAGAVVALATVAWKLDGGLAEMLRVGWEQRYQGAGQHAPTWWDWGKFTFFDFESRWPLVFTQPYTLLAAIVAATWGGIGPYGTDQLIAQRMFCCKDERQARRAIIVSAAGQIVTLIVMFVGVGLYAYYQHHALVGEALSLYTQEPNRIFPIFIVDVIPVGLKGMLIASIFAAAISSLTSILAALSQTTMSAICAPLANSDESAGSVSAGRLFVLAWAIVLAIVAYFTQYLTDVFPELLNLALALAGYAGGALLAGFFLGFWKLGIDGWGYQFSAPLSVLYVFAVVFHDPWAWWVACVGGGVLIAWWILATLAQHDRVPGVLPTAVQFLALCAGVMGLMLMHRFGYFDATRGDNGRIDYQILAFPWFVPLGSVVAFVWGVLLARRSRAPESPAS